MAPVTGVVQSGTYIVQNVASKHYAVLKDGNKGTAVTAGASPQDENAKWTITKLSNSKYNIMAYIHATYAKVGANPNSGDTVVGRSDEFQWDIKQTGKNGVYVISPSSDDQLYWGTINSSPNTNIGLHSDADDKATWQIFRVTA